MKRQGDRGEPSPIGWQISSAIRFVCDWVEGAFMLAGAMLLAIMIGAVTLEVVLRYVFEMPTYWAQTLARSTLISFVFLGLAVGVRRQENIGIDFFADRAIGRLRIVLAWTRTAFVFAFATVLLIYGWQLVHANWGQDALPGLGVPKGALQLPIPIAAAGILLFSVESIAAKEWSRF